MKKRYQVFVSSTFDDLKEERQEVMQALLELDCIPAGMELFPAANEDQWTLIKRVLDDSDYYILIIAGRYGSIGPTGLSYTEMEYRYALDTNKPIIAFLNSKPERLPANRTEETSTGKKKLDQFRKLAKKKPCKFWESPADLGGQVSRSIYQLIKSTPAIGWVRGNLIQTAVNTEPPERVFAISLIEFARTLSQQHRDQTLLEIRNWSSRILHLIGAIAERKELGQLALEAAAYAQDRLTQASILIDDLGWSVHESGDTTTAMHNVQEALTLLELELNVLPTTERSEVIALKIKAMRHLANMRSVNEADLETARQMFSEPRKLATELDLGSRDVNFAQLDHSEALVILRWIESRPDVLRHLGHSNGPNELLFNEAISLAERAERTFHSLGDTEREVKALKLRVDLLAYDARKQLHREAAVRLERLELQATRCFR